MDPFWPPPRKCWQPLGANTKSNAQCGSKTQCFYFKQFLAARLSKTLFLSWRPTAPNTFETLRRTIPFVLLPCLSKLCSRGCLPTQKTGCGMVFNVIMARQVILCWQLLAPNTKLCWQLLAANTKSLHPPPPPPNTKCIHPPPLPTQNPSSPPPCQHKNPLPLHPFPIHK